MVKDAENAGYRVVADFDRRMGERLKEVDGLLKAHGDKLIADIRKERQSFFDDLGQTGRSLLADLDHDMSRQLEELDKTLNEQMRTFDETIKKNLGYLETTLIVFLGGLAGLLVAGLFGAERLVRNRNITKRDWALMGAMAAGALLVTSAGGAAYNSTKDGRRARELKDELKVQLASQDLDKAVAISSRIATVFGDPDDEWVAERLRLLRRFIRFVSPRQRIELIDELATAQRKSVTRLKRIDSDILVMQVYLLSEHATSMPATSALARLLSLYEAPPIGAGLGEYSNSLRQIGCSIYYHSALLVTDSPSDRGPLTIVGRDVFLDMLSESTGLDRSQIDAVYAKEKVSSAIFYEPTCPGNVLRELDPLYSDLLSRWHSRAWHDTAVSFITGCFIQDDCDSTRMVADALEEYRRLQEQQIHIGLPVSVIAAAQYADWMAKGNGTSISTEQMGTVFPDESPQLKRAVEVATENASSLLEDKILTEVSSVQYKSWAVDIQDYHNALAAMGVRNASDIDGEWWRSAASYLNGLTEADRTKLFRSTRLLNEGMCLGGLFHPQACQGEYMHAPLAWLVMAKNYRKPTGFLVESLRPYEPLWQNKWLTLNYVRSIRYADS